MSVRRGLFITLEGGEGTGKSTAAKALAAHFDGLGRETVLTREPGGTPGAEAIRTLLLNPATRLVPAADTLLHFAARTDHVETLIRPALASGAIVICDRFYDSTMAYQSYGMGVAQAMVTRLIAMLGIVPDVTFVLQLNEFEAKHRLSKRGDAVDRYDLMGADFMARVAAGFLAIAAAEPARCQVINAAQPPEAVLADLLGRLASFAA